MLITKIYQPNEVKIAAKELKLGELIAFPTETVYGLGADATNEQAVKRVYLAKGRPSDNPLIVTVASEKMITKYTGPLSSKARKVIAKFWPGSLTLVFDIKPGSLPNAVTGGLTTAAFRCPANNVTRKLIELAGVPIVGPSANSSGKPSPTTAQHVFHDLEGRIAGIVDDGPTQVGVESTILDLSTEKPTILRPGGVDVTEIEDVLGEKVISDKHTVKNSEIPKAPGMKYRHYAPDAKVLIVRPNQWQSVFEWTEKQKDPIGVMATSDILASYKKNEYSYDLGKDVVMASRRLFAGLRYFDEMNEVKTILVAEFPEDGLGMAYMNRLKKAASNQYFE
ncbi:threonylcarbamoyl-AMP synthase [Ligilactobacillus sp. WILCCON 0076]|uniref:Threonylcarbamoyl-AMP synthase n=1 Tax=Ligilactobacillus ubinensis TaxID=2876789 RepID=A0A9X2FKF2_9LACO|nr:L-threonylcarbamoyladenylate synthase [Ligilactobacillus ubinensis]MCP0885963.1 threonylcarbamoyl-AMP synthase [Ligilactobacillus ubinensis]